MVASVTAVMYLLTLQKLLIAVALLHLARLAKGNVKPNDVAKGEVKPSDVPKVDAKSSDLANSDEKPSFQASVKAVEEDIKKFIPDGDKKIQPLEKQAAVVTSSMPKEQVTMITGAIKEIGGGITKIVSGVINKKWQDVVIGVIGLVSGMVLFAGPYGSIASAVLNFLSLLFGVLAAERKVVESQEAMLTRVIEDALLKARAEELRADADGVKKIILSLRNTITQFRESGVTQEQANELYTQVFTGLDFLGKLKYEINKFCDCSINVKLNKFTSEKSKEREKSVENSIKCLQFLNLYFDISVYRLLLIIDMTSLFSSNANTKKIGDMLFSLIEKEQASDAEILMFLFDPINNVRQRFCISQYHSAPYKYPSIMAYTGILNKNNVTQVTVCTDRELLGVCYKLSNSVRQFANTKNNGAWLGAWENKIESIYIPENIKLTGYSEPDFKGTSYGPYFGPTVIGTIFDSIVKDKDGNKIGWNSISMYKTNTNALEMIRVCKNENFDQNGVCLQLLQNDTDEYKLKIISPNLENNIKSVMIPERSQVFFYPQKGSRYGPFYGPNAIDSFCNSANVSSVLFQSIVKSVDVSSLVKICKGEYFTQQCEYLEVKDHRSTLFNGCDYAAAADNKGKNDVKIRSLFVPAGLTVDMWTEEDYKGIKMGPYIGPLSLSAIEGLDSDYKVKSLTVGYTYTPNVSPKKKKFIHRI